MKKMEKPKKTKRTLLEKIVATVKAALVSPPPEYDILKLILYLTFCVHAMNFFLHSSGIGELFGL